MNAGTGIRTIIAGAAVVLTLAGCSAGEDDQEAAAAPTWAPAASAMRQTCESVAAATRDVDVSSPPQQIGAAYDELVSISDEGDGTTKAALADLITAVRAVHELPRPFQGRKQVRHALATFDTYSASIRELGEKCTAAHSSALQ